MIHYVLASVWLISLSAIITSFDERKSCQSQVVDVNATFLDVQSLGVGLMEIVTEPDFETGEQSENFVREIQSTLQLINTCEGKMERKLQLILILMLGVANHRTVFEK